MPILLRLGHDLVLGHDLANQAVLDSASQWIEDALFAAANAARCVWDSNRGFRRNRFTSMRLASRFDGQKLSCPHRPFQNS
jgi:hypothetical protein